MPRTSAPDREAFWRKLIARHESSRLTIGELCQQSGVSTASFYAWRQRLKQPGGDTRPSSLVPVHIVADQRGGGEITVEITEPPTESPAIRVHIPPGCDEASIRRVLCAVLSAHAGGRPSC
jgi:transposase-like protein